MRIFEETGVNAAESILPLKQFKLFADMENPVLSEETRQSLIRNGEALLTKPFSPLSALDYMRFVRDGDRSVYEKVYFERRDTVFTLLLAEYAEGQGRFTDKLLEGVWHILEETTWVVPAHMAGTLTNEYTAKVTTIDLFSAATGALLAMVQNLSKKALDKACPTVSARILFELRRRIFKPFETNPLLWWTGESGIPVNNWNPWILSNILTAAALCVTAQSERAAIANRAMRYLDNFTAGYAPDGGCDEGPGYWNAAGASYFDCLNVLYDLSGGKIDVYGVPLIKNMGEYIMKAHIADRYFIPFADAHAALSASYPLIADFGKKVRSDALYAFGVSGSKKYGNIKISNYFPYRVLKYLFTAFEENVSYQPPKAVFLDNLCVAAFRESDEENKGLYLAIKGGSNAESHNHNDIGNFIVYSGGKPLIIDAGVGTYTRDTFSDKRYEIWTMQSSFHNLPQINGAAQRAGKKYAARDVLCELEKQTVSMQLKDAYPEEAGIESFVRTAALSDGAVTVTDALTLKEEGTIAFHILLCDKPHKADNGSIPLACGRVLTYNPTLSVKCEEIPLTDGGLHRDWERDKLYRLVFTEENTTGGAYIIIIQ